MAQSPSHAPGLAVLLTGIADQTPSSQTIAAHLDSLLRARVSCWAVTPILLDSLGRRAGAGLVVSRGKNLIGARWMIGAYFAELPADSLFLGLQLFGVETGEMLYQTRWHTPARQVDSLLDGGITQAAHATGLPAQAC